MYISKYLILAPGSSKWRTKVTLVNSLSGRMPSGAIALKLNLELPDTLFDKPQLQATIKINEGDISKPIINAAVLDNIKAEFSRQMGIDMNIQIVEPKTEE